MTTRRSYEDGCAVAHALDVVGERWALLVVRELLLGPKRFTDLRAGLPGISPNVLTQRLAELEQGGVLRKRKLGPPVGTWVYELTSWGQELEPVILGFGQWAARSPGFFPDCALSATSLMLSFKAMFRPERAEGLDAAYELVLGPEIFAVRVRGNCLDIRRDGAGGADVTVESGPNTMASVIYGGRPLDEALQAGEMSYQGNRPLLERFLRLFSLPPR